MSLQPTKNTGQVLPSLGGLLICVLNNREQVDLVSAKLNEAGYQNDELILLHGEDGINLIKRIEEDSTYFSDAPQQLFSRDQSVLAQGKFALGINVGSGTNARNVADQIRPLGANGFMHFGLFADTRFN